MTCGRLSTGESDDEQFIQVTLDLRWSLEEALTAIHAAVFDQSDFSTVDVPDVISDCTASSLKRCSGGFHPMVDARLRAHELVAQDKSDDTAESVLVQRLEGVFAHATPVLFWDGAMVGGTEVQTGESTLPLALSVTHIFAGGKNKFTMTVPASFTYQDLQVVLARRTGLQAQLMMIHRVVSKSNKIRATPLKADRRSNGTLPSLTELSLEDDDELIVESTLTAAGKTRNRPLAFDEAARRDKAQDIIVEYRLGQHVTLTLQTQGARTLASFKEACLAKYLETAVGGSGKPPTPETTRFRGTYQGTDGVLVQDETETLKGVGLGDGDRVILELGQAPCAGTIAIQYRIVNGNRLEEFGGGVDMVMSEVAEVIVPENVTGTALKEAICKAAGMSDPEEEAKRRRLRKTNFRGEGDRLVWQEGDPMKKQGVYHGSLLLLEQGVIPEKGLITFSVKLWQPQACASAWADVPPDEVLAEAIEARRQALIDAELNVTGDSMPIPDDAYDHVLHVRRAAVGPGIDISMNKAVSTKELLACIVSDTDFFNAICHTPYYDLGGRADWRCLRDSGVDADQLSVRLLGDDALPTSALRLSDKPISSYHLANGRTVVVQPVGREQGGMVPGLLAQPVTGSDHLVLHVQRRCPAVMAAAEGGVSLYGTAEPRYPPHMVVFECNAQPKLADLKACLAPYFPDIPVESMGVARFLGQKVEWLKFDDNFDSTAAAVAGRKGKKGKRGGGKGGGQPRHLKAGPLRLVDGTQLAVTDQRVAGWKQDNMLRPEDVAMQQRQLLKGELKRLVRQRQKEQRASGGAGRREVHAALRIGDSDSDSDPDVEETNRDVEQE